MLVVILLLVRYGRGFVANIAVLLVESVPTFVLGGAGLVVFGMVAATGIRMPGQR